MTKPLLRLAILGFIALNSSCAIEKNLPLSRFEIPEVAEESGFGGEFRGWLNSERKVVISDDATIVSKPLNDPPKIEEAVNTGAGSKFVFVPHLELGIDLTLSGPPRATLKYQVLGDGPKKAKTGNFSIAALVGGWPSTAQRDTDQIFSEGEAYQEIRDSYWEAMLIFGYRVNDLMLVYGGPRYMRFTYEGSLKQTDENGATLFDRGFGDAIRVSSFNLGFNTFFKPGGRMFLRGEATWNQLRSRAGRSEHVSGGAALGFIY